MTNQISFNEAWKSNAPLPLSEDFGIVEENINSENISEVYILQMEYVSTVPLQIGAKSDNLFLPHCFVGFTWT